MCFDACFLQHLYFSLATFLLSVEQFSSFIQSILHLGKTSSMKPLSLFVIYCLSITASFSQNVPIPSNYSVVESVFGDLDKDGVDELVVAYNTKSNEDEIREGVPRELIIYKKLNNKWTIWQKSMQALSGSSDGGPMGDPFGEISIEKGILKIYHEGGGSWKWNHTDKYRFDGKDFRLIGYESYSGMLCEHWEGVDFNLVTGKINFTKEFERCTNEGQNQEVYKRENETFFKKGIVITLQNRSAKDIVIVSPKYRHEIYLATTLD